MSTRVHTTPEITSFFHWNLFFICSFCKEKWLGITVQNISLQREHLTPGAPSPRAPPQQAVGARNSTGEFHSICNQVTQVQAVSEYAPPTYHSHVDYFMRENVYLLDEPKQTFRFSTDFTPQAKERASLSAILLHMS